MSNITLLEGDCLELMGTIPEKSVDCIICDLPYGTTSIEWDRPLPLDRLWECYKRVLKETGVVILFGSQPFTSMLVQSNPTWFREELIWLKNKSGSGFKMTSRHMKIHENIIVFAEGTRYTYNPQKWLIAEKEFITQRKTFKENEYLLFGIDEEGYYYYCMWDKDTKEKGMDFESLIEVLVYEIDYHTQSFSVEEE